MKRSSRPTAMFVAAILCSGCMLPTYHLPAGYSSTYHQALDAQSGFLAAPSSMEASASAGAVRQAERPVAE